MYNRGVELTGINLILCISSCCASDNFCFSDDNLSTVSEKEYTYMTTIITFITHDNMVSYGFMDTDQR